MKAIYEATYDVPELGVEAGDFLVVRPGDPTTPVRLMIRMGHEELVQLMPHLGDFILHETSGVSQPAVLPRRRRNSQPLRLIR